MEIAILGLPQSGKSTIFRIMTGLNSSEYHGERTVQGLANVPDIRFDTLVDIFKPKKVSPARIPFTDVIIVSDNPWGEIRQSVGNADGILHIIDGFTSSDSNDLLASYKKLKDELIFSDLVMVENRMERLKKIPTASLKGDEIIQAKILPEVLKSLEAGQALSTLDLSTSEIHSLKGFSFWTLKPELIVINTSEENADITDQFKELLAASSPVIGICCQVESEIAELPNEERISFLNAMGISKPAFEKVIQESFSLLNRISYFTVGEDEVKAWVIPANSTAPKAASAIHKDFERGFIKAEIVSYNDFILYGKTIASAKAAGKLRLEGKDYIVQDGDIISFRFNI